MSSSSSLSGFLSRHRLEHLVAPLQVLGVEDVSDLRFITPDILTELEGSASLTQIQKKKLESLVTMQAQLAIQEDELFRTQSLQEVYSSKCDSMRILLTNQKITQEEYDEWRRDEFSKLFPSRGDYRSVSSIEFDHRDDYGRRSFGGFSSARVAHSRRAVSSGGASGPVEVPSPPTSLVTSANLSESAAPAEVGNQLAAPPISPPLLDPVITAEDSSPESEPDASKNTHPQPNLEVNPLSLMETSAVLDAVCTEEPSATALLEPTPVPNADASANASMQIEAVDATPDMNPVLPSDPSQDVNTSDNADAQDPINETTPEVNSQQDSTEKADTPQTVLEAAKDNHIDADDEVGSETAKVTKQARKKATPVQDPIVITEAEANKAITEEFHSYTGYGNLLNKIWPYLEASGWLRCKVALIGSTVYVPSWAIRDANLKGQGKRPKYDLKDLKVNVDYFADPEVVLLYVYKYGCGLPPDPHDFCLTPGTTIVSISSDRSIDGAMQRSAQSAPEKKRATYLNVSCFVTEQNSNRKNNAPHMAPLSLVSTPSTSSNSDPNKIVLDGNVEAAPKARRKAKTILKEADLRVNETNNDGGDETRAPDNEPKSKLQKVSSHTKTVISSQECESTVFGHNLSTPIELSNPVSNEEKDRSIDVVRDAVGSDDTENAPISTVREFESSAPSEGEPGIFLQASYFSGATSPHQSASSTGQEETQADGREETLAMPKREQANSQVDQPHIEHLPQQPQQQNEVSDEYQGEQGNDDYGVFDPHDEISITAMPSEDWLDHINPHHGPDSNPDSGHHSSSCSGSVPAAESYDEADGYMLYNSLSSHELIANNSNNNSVLPNTTDSAVAANVPAQQSTAARPRRSIGQGMRVKRAMEMMATSTVCHVCQETRAPLQHIDARAQYELMNCASCDVSVHAECYPCSSYAQNTDNNETWQCEACKEGKSPATLRCVLCSHKGGAYLKLPDTGKWVHALCSTWCFGIPRTCAPVAVMSTPVSAPASTDDCEICHEPKKGVSVQCAHRGCGVSVHPWCLLAPRTKDKRRRYDIEMYIVRERDSNFEKKLIECSSLVQASSISNPPYLMQQHEDAYGINDRSFVWKFHCERHAQELDLDLTVPSSVNLQTMLSGSSYRSVKQIARSESTAALLSADGSISAGETEQTTDASRRVDTLLLPSLLQQYNPEVSDALLSLLENGLDMAAEHYLRSHPAVANLIDYISNETLLSKACSMGKFSVCKTLVECGADVNFSYADGNTVLHEVCLRRQIKFATFLISKGASINMANKAGVTPLDCVKAKTYREAVIEASENYARAQAELAARAADLAYNEQIMQALSVPALVSNTQVSASTEAAAASITVATISDATIQSNEIPRTDTTTTQDPAVNSNNELSKGPKKSGPKKDRHAVKFDQDVDEAQARKSAHVQDTTISVQDKYRRRRSVKLSTTHQESSSSSSSSALATASSSATEIPLAKSSKSFFTSTSTKHRNSDAMGSPDPGELSSVEKLTAPKRRGRKPRKVRLDDELSLSSEILTTMRSSGWSDAADDDDNEDDDNADDDDTQTQEGDAHGDGRQSSSDRASSRHSSVQFALPSTFSMRSGYSSANESRKSFDDTISLNFLSGVSSGPDNSCPSTPVTDVRFVHPKSSRSGRSIGSSAEETNSVVNSVACVDYFLRHGKRRRGSGDLTANTLGYSTDNSIFTGHDDDDDDNDDNEDGDDDGNDDKVDGGKRKDDMKQTYLTSGTESVNNASTIPTHSAETVLAGDSQTLYQTAQKTSDAGLINSSEQTLGKLEDPELLQYMNQLSD